MNIELTASTTGADDAKALAQFLEHAAAAVRAAGGDQVTDSGSRDFGGQPVHFAFTTNPYP